MRDAGKFWDKFAKRYAKTPIKNMAAYDQTIGRTIDHLSGDDLVLEIGCGTGSTALRLAGSVSQLTASDISPNMIDIARHKAADQNVKNVSFLPATPFDPTFENASFDAILAYNFLHLLEDPAAVIQRVNTLLKPGGVFISKTLCMTGHSKLWPVLLPVMQMIGLAPYVRFLTVPELENLISTENFEILETGDYPASPPSHFIVARKT